MPAPFMYDASGAPVPGSPARSDAVTQNVTQQGGKSVVTVKPDLEWLRDKSRVYPIVIDPTIAVVPDPAAGQDTALREQAPT